MIRSLNSNPVIDLIFMPCLADQKIFDVEFSESLLAVFGFFGKKT